MKLFEILTLALLGTAVSVARPQYTQAPPRSPTTPIDVGSRSRATTANGLRHSGPSNRPAIVGGCDVYDDGSDETSFGIPGGGETVWLQKQASACNWTEVTAIDVATGSAVFPGNSVPNGTAARVAIWQDTDNDGDPSTNMQFLQAVNFVLAGVDTDTFQTIPLNPPLWVTGTYFIGVAVPSPSFAPSPAPLDQSVLSAGRSWFTGTTSPPFNLVTLGPGIGFFENDSYGLSGVWLLRAECLDKTSIESFCPGDGTGMACPCVNNSPNPGEGCLWNSLTTGGLLSATGCPSLAADTLQFTCVGHRPSNFALSQLWQGLDTGGFVSYGDGLRCIGSPMKRLFTFTPTPATLVAPSGSSVPPLPATVSGQSASGSVPDVLFPGAVRGYQLFYRDPVSFCTPFTFNASNGVRVVWGP